MLLKKFIRFLLVASLISYNLSAFAVTDIVPASAQAGRVEIPLKIPTTTLPSPGGPRIAAPESTQPKASPEALAIRFKLNGIVITGNTVYCQSDLYYLFKDYLNREISLADLQSIAHSITLKYRNDGYILTKAIIPPQKITNGVVTIQVVEGFVDKVTVEGNAKTSRCLIQKYGNKVTCYRPFNIKVLERYILLANDLPGVDVKAVIKPSQTTPGAASIVLVADEDHFESYGDYNNRGTISLGPHQYTLGAVAQEMLFGGDRTEFRFSGTTVTQELQFYELNHQEQIGSEGLQATLDAYYTKSQPGSYLEPLEVTGKSTSFSGNLNFPLVRSRLQNLYFNSGLQYLLSKSDIIGNQLLYEDRIYALTLGTNYDLADRFLGVNRAGFLFTQGLPILNANSGNEPPPSRTDAANNFTKLNLNLSRLQTLPKNFSLYLSGAAQYAFNSLYSAEQFGVGSYPFGGAYDPSEIVGDKGAAARAELRYFLPINKVYISGAQLYGYYDGGIIWNINSSSQPARQSLTSTGIGVRMQLVKYVSAYTEWAQPLTKAVAAQEAAGRNGYAPRLFFGISARI